MEQITVFRNNVCTKLKKTFRCIHVSRFNKGVRNQGAVPWPHIRIGISPELDNIKIICRNDGAIVINLCPDDQQTPLKKRNKMPGEIVKVKHFLIDPQFPVVFGAPDQLFRCFLPDILIELYDFTVPRSRCNPIMRNIFTISLYLEINAKS